MTNLFDCKGGPGTTEPACGACVTCLHRVIESKDAEVTALRERIKRLEEAGSILWKKASSITVRECYNREMDEIPVSELPPDTVVFDYDHGDGIPAKAIVELNDALDIWTKAKEEKP